MAVTAALMALIGPDTSLWWLRGLMFVLGVSMAGVFVPVQAAAFATISPAATGRGSTMFNALRQLGGAIGVAAFTSAIVAVGAFHRVSGHVTPELGGYHVAFPVSYTHLDVYKRQVLGPGCSAVQPAKAARK